MEPEHTDATHRVMDTQQKAQEINLDNGKYGTFAEIGAGQEVARWFFRATGASGTIAKSISAYDMQVSDAIYGPTERYVSQQRLNHMLDHEFGLMQERLTKKRGSNTRFFSYANTVAARGFKRKEDGQGWMGIRFQTDPNSPPSDIVLHVRLMDPTNLQEQEAAGIVGVNLIHAALYHHHNPDQIIASLMDGLSPDRVEIGMIRFSGHAFQEVDNRIMSLQLVERGLTQAAIFDVNGGVIHAADVLYRKPIIVERGSFRPVTRTTLHMLQSALKQFSTDPKLSGLGHPVVLFEMTLKNLSDGGVIDHKDFLERVDMLGAVGAGLGEDYHVMVSNYAEFHRLAGYLFRYTKYPIGVAMGMPTLRELFEEKYYSDLEGGILESFGRLFKNDLRLYVYPQLDPANGHLVTVSNCPVPRHLTHLYTYLLQKESICGLDDFNESFLAWHSRDVLARIRAGDPTWENLVPPQVADIIKQRALLGCKAAGLTSALN